MVNITTAYIRELGPRGGSLPKRRLELHAYGLIAIIAFPPASVSDIGRRSAGVSWLTRLGKPNKPSISPECLCTKSTTCVMNTGDDS